MGDVEEKAKAGRTGAAEAGDGKDNKRAPSLVYYTATGMEVATLSQGYSRLLSEGVEMRVVARTQQQLFDDSRRASFVREAMEADVLIIYLHGGPDSFAAIREFEEAMADPERARKPFIHVQPSASDVEGLDWARKWSGAFGTPEYERAYLYHLSGGMENFSSLLKLF